MVNKNKQRTITEYRLFCKKKLSKELQRKVLSILKELETFFYMNARNNTGGTMGPGGEGGIICPDLFFK